MLYYADSLIGYGRGYLRFLRLMLRSRDLLLAYSSSRIEMCLCFGCFVDDFLLYFSVSEGNKNDSPFCAVYSISDRLMLLHDESIC